MIKLRIGSGVKFSAVCFAGVFALSATAGADSPYGYCSHIVGGPERDHLETAVGLVKDAGCGWIRDGLTWERLQRHPGDAEWDFSVPDRAIAEMEKHGLKYLAILHCHRNGKPDFQQASRDPEQWLGYVTKCVERYKGRVGAWEIWNEVNILAKIDNQMSAAEYADFLRREFAGSASFGDVGFVDFEAKLSAEKWDAVFFPFDESYPADAMDAVMDFVAKGGTLVDLGSYATAEPCTWKATGGRIVKFAQAQHPLARRDRDRLRFRVLSCWDRPVKAPEAVPSHVTSALGQDDLPPERRVERCPSCRERRGLPGELAVDPRLAGRDQGEIGRGVSQGRPADRLPVRDQDCQVSRRREARRAGRDRVDVGQCRRRAPLQGGIRDLVAH